MSNNSNETDLCSKKRLISKGLALLLGITAMYILWGVWVPIITKQKFKTLFDLIFLLTFPFPCTALSIYFFHSAGIMWKGISSRGIHKLSVCLSLIFSALLLIIISGIKGSISPRDEFFWTEVPTTFIMIATGLFHLQLKRGLFKSFSVAVVIDYAAHRRATKLYFIFLGLSVWYDIVGATEFLPKYPDFEYLPTNQWLGALITLGSISLAFCCYKMGLKLFLKKPPIVKNNNETTTEFLDAGINSG